MAGLELRSPAFSDHDLLPERFSRAATNTSPPLEWSETPHGTRELVLLCEDPDAPGGTFLHWLVTGVEPSATGTPEGMVPRGGKEHRNGFGETGWGGPQPPVGDPPHRYFFHLYALADPVRLPADADAEAVHAAVDGAALASGTLVGTFAR